MASIFESGSDWCVSNIGMPGKIYIRRGTESKNITYDEAKVLINDAYGVAKGYMVDFIAALKQVYEDKHGPMGEI